MSLPYRRPSEFIDRYSSSVIYYKNEPVWITGITPQRDSPEEEYEKKETPPVYLNFQRLPYDSREDNRTHKFLASDENFSAVPIHVGYSNGFVVYHDKTGDVTKRALYLTRMPVRRNKQGLCQQNLLLPRNSGTDFNHLLYSQDFIDMLKNVYTSFEDVKKKVYTQRETVQSVAFDKKLALEYNVLGQFILYYKGQQIAYSLDGDRFVLTPESRFLQEVLESKGLKVK